MGEHSGDEGDGEERVMSGRSDWELTGRGVKEHQNSAPPPAVLGEFQGAAHNGAARTVPKKNEIWCEVCSLSPS